MQFKCPRCGNSLTDYGAIAGRIVQCLSCGERFPIQIPATVPAVAKPAVVAEIVLETPDSAVGEKGKCPACDAVPAIPVKRPAWETRTARILAAAGIDDAHVANEIDKALRESFDKGPSFKDFRRIVKAALGDKQDVRDAQLEFVFRNYVMGAFAERENRQLENPIVQTVFPYAMYSATHDGRTADEHWALETLGIDGTNIYRCDDPVWLKFQPPWGLSCRCLGIPLRIADAARYGVKEAQEWLRTGQPPAKPAWVPMPPFDPDLTPCEILGVREEIPYTLKKLANASERDWLARVLDEMCRGAKPAVVALTDILKGSKDASVRLATAMALWSIEKRVDLALPTFVDLLRNGEPRVRQEILEALDEWGPDEVASAAVQVPDLLIALANARETNWVAEVLEEIGPEAIGATVLLDLLEIPDSGVRQQVLDALYWHTDVVARLAGESPDLLRALASAGETNWVVEVLGEISGDAKSATPALTGLMASAENELVQLAAMMALWRIEHRDELVLPVLLDRLKSPRADVRCQSLEALKQLRAAASDALSAILPRLRDEDASVRCAAIGAAASVAPASADVVAALTETLRDTEGSVRFEGAHALIWFGPVARGALPTCLQILRDKSELGRAEVSTLMARIAPDSQPVVEALTLALKDRTNRVRISAVNALAEIGPAAKTAVPALTLLLQNRSKDVREAAAEALKHIAPDAAAGDSVG
jgi:HEAT repeat protein